MPYRHLILDADGTLFDFERSESAALARTLGAEGIAVDTALLTLYRTISLELWQALERGETTPGRLRVERFARLAERGGLAFDRSRVAAAYLDELALGIDLLPEVEETLAALAGSTRMLLATNGLATVQRRRFARAPIRRHFVDVVISEEIGAAKPQPEFFAEALRRLGAPPREEVLVVGDSLSADIAGAAAAGIDACWFNPRRLPLVGARPRFEIAVLAELPALVAERYTPPADLAARSARRNSGRPR